MPRQQVIIPADAPDWAKRLQPELDRALNAKTGSRDLPAGTILQSVFDSYTANADLPDEIPYDDTLPDAGAGEGTEILSLAITPTSNTTTLRLRFRGMVTSNGGTTAIAAAFDGTTCLGASAVFMADGGEAYQLSLEAEWMPGDVAEHTISIRAGADTGGGPLRFNGSVSNRLLGGASAATLVVEEIQS